MSLAITFRSTSHINNIGLKNKGKLLEKEWTTEIGHVVVAIVAMFLHRSLRQLMISKSKKNLYIPAKKTQLMRFELTREDPTRFQVWLLNRSDTTARRLITFYDYCCNYIFIRYNFNHLINFEDIFAFDSSIFVYLF